MGGTVHGPRPPPHLALPPQEAGAEGSLGKPAHVLARVIGVAGHLGEAPVTIGSGGRLLAQPPWLAGGGARAARGAGKEGLVSGGGKGGLWVGG